VLQAEPLLTDPTGLDRVSASSEKGISGVVDLRAPVTTLSEAIVPLPQAFVDVTALLPARCAARLSGGTYSSLVVGGRDGLPLEPGGVLPSPLVLEDDGLMTDPPGARDGGRTASAPFALLAQADKVFPRMRGGPPQDGFLRAPAQGCPK
jgi:hypothetical protein